VPQRQINTPAATSLECGREGASALTIRARDAVAALDRRAGSTPRCSTDDRPAGEPRRERPGPRDIRHAVAMTVPCAWERDPDIDEDTRAFFRWHEARMEPWDARRRSSSPTGVVGAALDRGAPAQRWAVTETARRMRVRPASSTSPRPDRPVRLGPGDDRRSPAAASGGPVRGRRRARPYAIWLDRERTRVLPLATEPRPPTSRGPAMHGLTRRTSRRPLTGHEPTFSMGDDTPIPPSHARDGDGVPATAVRPGDEPALDHLLGLGDAAADARGPAPVAARDGPARLRSRADTFLRRRRRRSARRDVGTRRRAGAARHCPSRRGGGGRDPFGAGEPW
jgi:hypothetical protein